MSELDKNWRGTAGERAAAAAYFRTLGAEDPKLNERLVRYYAHKRVLSPPARDGGGFGYRQLLELVVTRHLVRDRCPLEKIAALTRDADESPYSTWWTTSR